MNTWQKVTLQKSSMVAKDVKSLVFKADSKIDFLPGQHFSIKIKTKDGYITKRDYSIANPPEQNEVIEFGIQLLEEGEVSPSLFALKPGAEIEINGPIGRSFTWKASTDNKPLLLVGGGSGVVALRSILLHHFNNYKPREVILFMSFKSQEYVVYKDELEQLAKEYKDFKIIYTFTKRPPDNFSEGYTRRIDKNMVQEVFGSYKKKQPNIFICGPTPFVEAATISFINVGFNPSKIKSERFG